MLFNLIRPDSCRSYSSIDSEVKYAVILEMPNKVRGGDILHVMAFAKNFEMPQNRTVSVFQTRNIRSIRTNIDSKMGHFKNFELEKVGHFKN